MFESSGAINHEISGWNISTGTDFDFMFRDSPAFDQGGEIRFRAVPALLKCSLMLKVASRKPLPILMVFFLKDNSATIAMIKLCSVS